MVCQYYPPGNTLAGAENIGDDAENVGALKPVLCKKPTVENGVVTPDAATINEGEKYTVTCSENFELERIENTFTCSVDGSLTPSSHYCRAVIPDGNGAGKGSRSLK